MSAKKPLALVILDGWGYREDNADNAIANANTPVMDELLAHSPNTLISASGIDVGLPDGQMGNSEVGHINIGAGRVVYQDIQKINNSIRNNELQNNVVLNNSFNELKKNQSRLHFLGLLSDGGVHSHYDHFEAFLKIAKDNGIQNTFVHAFLDGRDTPPKSAKKYLDKLDTWISSNGYGVIGSISGRFYAMDRDNRWERIKLAYDLLVHGMGKVSANVEEAIQQSYDDGVTDEFIKPIWFEGGKTIEEGDVVINFNFRTDRGRQITKALTQQDYPEQQMTKMDLHYVTFTSYDDTFKKVQILFEDQDLVNDDPELFWNTSFSDRPDRCLTQEQQTTLITAIKAARFDQLEAYYATPKDEEISHQSVERWTINEDDNLQTVTVANGFAPLQLTQLRLKIDELITHAPRQEK